MLSAIRKTAPGVEDEAAKGGEEKMEEDSGEEKKVEKKVLTGEEAELQSKVRKFWTIIWWSNEHLDQDDAIIATLDCNYEILVASKGSTAAPPVRGVLQLPPNCAQ